MSDMKSLINSSRVIGRYAPSPTGALHLGNLRTALLAWLQVRVFDGEFLLRMEDLDTPRAVKGSASKILKDLEWLGLDWDGDVVYQSQRLSLYEESLEFLKERDLIYPCYCSRKDIQQAASAPHNSPGVYPGLCRDLSSEQQAERVLRKSPALRFKVEGNLQASCGDFVVKRADNLFAYQLAVVVDDLDQSISEVLRGADLEGSTDRQLYLAKVLKPEARLINYTHVPLMLDEFGIRLSKRDGSLSVDEYIGKGGNAKQMLAQFAVSLNLLESCDEISANELLELLKEKVKKRTLTKDCLFISQMLDRYKTEE